MPASAPAPKAPPPRFRLFTPLLAGATLRERSLACLGALIGISLTGFLTGLMLGLHPALPLLVAPMGASAVLLFAVPTSPLAQPWSIVGGNTISALCGFLVIQVIPDVTIAAGVAVALAIAVMSVTRSLHPPGGAAALSVVLGGTVVAEWGILFPLIPVGLNACVLLGVGLLFHRLAGRSYPHRTPAPKPTPQGTSDLPAPLRVGFHDEDMDAALAALDQSFDIKRDDLGRILREIERHATLRTHGDLSSADIMARDVVSIAPEASHREARTLLIRHNIRVLPVIDGTDMLLGTVGLRDLSHPDAIVGDAVIPAKTTAPDTPAVSLLPVLTDGRTHAVMVTDPQRRLVGLISQTDLLSALGRMVITGPHP